MINKNQALHQQRNEKIAEKSRKLEDLNSQLLSQLDEKSKTLNDITKQLTSSGIIGFFSFGGNLNHESVVPMPTSEFYGFFMKYV